MSTFGCRGGPMSWFDGRICPNDAFRCSADVKPGCLEGQRPVVSRRPRVVAEDKGPWVSFFAKDKGTHICVPYTPNDLFGMFGPIEQQICVPSHLKRRTLLPQTANGCSRSNLDEEEGFADRGESILVGADLCVRPHVVLVVNPVVGAAYMRPVVSYASPTLQMTCSGCSTGATDMCTLPSQTANPPSSVGSDPFLSRVRPSRGE